MLDTRDGSITAAAWHSFALTYNSSTANIYIDNAQILSANCDLSTSQTSTSQCVVFQSAEIFVSCQTKSARKKFNFQECSPSFVKQHFLKDSFVCLIAGRLFLLDWTLYPIQLATMLQCSVSKSLTNI